MKINKVTLLLSALFSSALSANVVVEATSDEATPIVEVTGGNVSFDRAIKNTGNEVLNLRYYDTLVFPNGELYNRSNAANLTLTAGQVFAQAQPRISVLPEFPAGEYKYILSVYNKVTGEITSANFTFNKKYSEHESRSCAEILANGLSTGSGVYSIKPDNVQSPYKVYCDMETHGGGWTLVGIKSKTQPNVQVDELLSLDQKANVITDQKWAGFKYTAQEMLVTADNDTAAILDMVTLNSANCTPLANSLTDDVLAHAESAGCTGAGQDYSFLNSAKFKTSVYDYSNTKFIIERFGNGWGVGGNGPYHYNAQNMWLYVR
ncbi:hypothetical protein N473_00855 [Pseudoalteromonas luteoviolacea CPMOR-1]|uniref:Fibrinogen C-terminal domain-containing protein n=1 Tax=Pseudoalteromonas luteoviolacea CPMOR-1 TaxID=1365248 RepID=A0A161YSJ9_9GAMM|nr:fibrinogen-like YCDxxxxGGGW domain-containing protein [Pseudoalteromonas luteoviolacea]KZN65150.1 hypothetical protein N473_00855 [Pseudoalteromonas luteoviolacea CPMOR-1]